MGIPADVVKALVEDLEIKAIPRHEDQDGGVQQMVVATMAALQRIASDVNSMSVTTDDVNRRQSYFEYVLKASGRTAGPEVECGELNKMSDAGSQTYILGDSEGCLSRSKQEHSKLAASDLFNNPGLQNGGGIDLAESPWMLEEPSQPEANTVVSCLCSSSVRSKSPHAHGAVSVSRDVVGYLRRQEGSTNSGSDVYRWTKIRVAEFRGGDNWSYYLVQFRTIMKMQWCDDNDVIVF